MGQRRFGTRARESVFEMLQTSIFSACVAALRDWKKQVEAEPGGTRCHTWSLQVVRSADLLSQMSLSQSWDCFLRQRKCFPPGLNCLDKCLPLFHVPSSLKASKHPSFCKVLVPTVLLFALLMLDVLPPLHQHDPHLILKQK